MSNEIIQVLGAIVAILAFSMYVASLRSKRDQELDNKIISKLSEMKIDNLDETSVKKEIISTFNDIRQSRSSSPISFLGGIEWDIAGVIGVLVTLTIILMLVLERIETIPPEFFAAWTMILGYYFGKSQGGSSK